jgi:hypothetical protein
VVSCVCQALVRSGTCTDLVVVATIGRAEEIPSGPPDEHVFTGPSSDNVVPSCAEDLVVTPAREDDVVPAQSVNHVVAAQPAMMLGQYSNAMRPFAPKDVAVAGGIRPRTEAIAVASSALRAARERFVILPFR